MNIKKQNFEWKCVNTLRLLAVDMVEKAQSGHPGMPMGAASMAYILWKKILKHSPSNYIWHNRDRFILSAGHGSTLLYSLLYLSGYGISLDDLKNFRQLGSRTPGYPEYKNPQGTEITTGLSGQGFANGVGMAIAEAYLAEIFNRPGFNIVDYNIYAICGDGDLMEGISSEAASIAGHLGLGKLIYLYDNNDVSIEGSSQKAFTENIGSRFESFGWQVLQADGSDLDSIENSLVKAKGEIKKPSLIMVKTHIADGSPNFQDTAKSHGSPLGDEEIALIKEKWGFPEDKTFYVPEDVLVDFRELEQKGIQVEKEWAISIEKYSQSYPDLYEKWRMMENKMLPSDVYSHLPSFNEKENISTEKASGMILNSITMKLPMLVGASAALSPSSLTNLKGLSSFSPDSFGCPNFQCGVRENAMGAIINGIAVSDMLFPYCSSFLVLSDYMRTSIRLTAMMNLHACFIFTHDSIGVGEDGPAYQPVEQLTALRAIPNLTILRPADAKETKSAWKLILKLQKPYCLILGHQDTQILNVEEEYVDKHFSRGAYLIEKPHLNTDLILIATGSEVQLIIEASKILKAKNINVRIVSMPSWELFNEQDEPYKRFILPPEIHNRIAVEAGSKIGWEKYVGEKGIIIGIDSFGVSGKSKDVLKRYGFTVENIVNKAQELINVK